MAEQQREFEAWVLGQFPGYALDEINPGDLAFARAAWTAALSHAEGSQHLVDASVTFVDGLGASRNKPSDCREGLKYITAGPITYWPLSTDDEQRLRRAECGDGEFHGPTVSHAEGEAVPVGYLSVLSDGTRIVDTRQQYDAPEVWPLYTHPAPQVAFSDTQEEIEARLADQLENSCPHCGGSGHKDDVTAPQVAVPEGYAVVPVEPTNEMQEAGGRAIRFETTTMNKLWTGNKVYAAMLAAAPTAPAGELCQGDIEIPGDDGLDIHALEQPVSDPDGLLVPTQSDPNWELRVANALNVASMDEARTIIHAVLEEAPGDSVSPRHPEVVKWRDDAIRACAEIAERYGDTPAAEDIRKMLTQAPDEREIATYRQALEEIAPYPSSRDVELGYSACRRIASAALKQGDRLRAGKEGEQS